MLDVVRRPVRQRVQRVWEQTGQRWGELAMRLAPPQWQQVQTSAILRGFESGGGNEKVVVGGEWCFRAVGA